jgi:glycosyltransferase involved in cell wall biosynthesis
MTGVPAAPLRIVALHSGYVTRGGEDASFDAEVAVLRDLGHDVVELVRHGSDLMRSPPVQRARRVVWNADAAGSLTELVRQVRPDVAYVNNYFPALSASCLEVLGRSGIPTVLAVRNYRLACAPGGLFRDGVRCHSCLGRRFPLPAVTHACYKGSAAASAVAATALVTARHTVARHTGTVRFAPISEYLNRFLRQLGIPADRATTKPGTMWNPPAAQWSAGDYVLLAGRLEPEKGLRYALDAVRATPGLRLLVAGTGSQLAEARRTAPVEQVEFLGWRPAAEVLRLISGARATLVPSVWDEPFGRVAMESLACGTPVVVSDRGGLPEIPEDSVSGLVVDPTDGTALVRALTRIQREEWWRGGARRAARARFDACFAPEAVGPLFEDILRSAASAGRAARGSGDRADATQLRRVRHAH